MSVSDVPTLKQSSSRVLCLWYSDFPATENDSLCCQAPSCIPHSHKAISRENYCCLSKTKINVENQSNSTERKLKESKK